MIKAKQFVDENLKEIRGKRVFGKVQDTTLSVD